MLSYLYIFFIGGAVLAGMLVSEKKLHRAYRLFTIFLLVTLLNEVLCYYVKLAGYYTLWIYNLYYYFRVIFLAYIFQTLLPSGHWAIKYVIRPFYLVTLLLGITFYIKYDGIEKQLHGLYFMVGGVFIIANCLILFYESLKRTEGASAWSQPFLISSVALFIYFLGILPFIGLINFLIKNHSSLSHYGGMIAQGLSVLIYSLISLDYYKQWTQNS